MLYPVLLIDDDPINNILNEILLTNVLGSDKVKIIPNGYEALDYIEDYQRKVKGLPQYIIIDIMMPGIDGFEFIKSVNKKYTFSNDTSIIILTNSQHSKDKAMAMELGVDYYIEKPLTAQKVEAIIAYSKNKKLKD